VKSVKRVGLLACLIMEGFFLGGPKSRIRAGRILD